MPEPRSFLQWAAGAPAPDGGDSSRVLKGDKTWANGPAGDPSGAWPVGSIFISAVSTNPATLLGFGTWSTIGAGRVLIGVDAADPDFDTALETGGAKTHTLTVNEMPAHTHVQALPTSQTGSQSSGTRDTSTTGSSADALSTGSTGGGTAFSIMPPYLAVFFWQRTG